MVDPIDGIGTGVAVPDGGLVLVGVAVGDLDRVGSGAVVVSTVTSPATDAGGGRTSL
jgi:serine acetyltransferase